MKKTIVLVSHFGLAKGMKTAAEFILGEQADFYAIELDNEGITSFKERLKELSKNFDDQEIILISDIPSGSPGTTSFTELNHLGHVSLVSGMNLPLVIEMLLMRESKSTSELIADGITSSQQAIIDFGAKLAESDTEEEDF